MCELKEETMDHFMECQSYGTKSEIIKWRDIYKNNTEKQFEIAKEVQKRLKIRNMKTEEAWTLHLAPQLPLMLSIWK